LVNCSSDNDASAAPRCDSRADRTRRADRPAKHHRADGRLYSGLAPRCRRVGRTGAVAASA